MVIGAAAIAILPAGCLKITLYFSGWYELGQHSQTEHVNLIEQSISSRCLKKLLTDKKYQLINKYLEMKSLMEH